MVLVFLDVYVTDKSIALLQKLNGWGNTLYHDWAY